MKRAILVCMIAGAAASQVAMGADAPTEMAKAKNCLTCHSVAAKIVGPAYKDVAAKKAQKTSWCKRY